MSPHDYTGDAFEASKAIHKAIMDTILAISRPRTFFPEHYLFFRTASPTGLTAYLVIPDGGCGLVIEDDLFGKAIQNTPIQYREQLVELYVFTERCFQAAHGDIRAFRDKSICHARPIPLDIPTHPTEPGKPYPYSAGVNPTHKDQLVTLSKPTSQPDSTTQTPSNDLDPNFDDRAYVWLAHNPHEESAMFNNTTNPRPDERWAVYLNEADAKTVDPHPTRIPIYDTRPSPADRHRWNRIKTREQALAKLTPNERAALGL